MEAYPYTWIDSDTALQTCCDELQQSATVAVDTEFMRTSTFFPRAALFQLSNGNKTYLIDPLSIDEFQPLGSLFTAANVTKVFHSCSEDLEVIQYFLNCLPQPIIDTQIAAALLNIGSAVGYGNLVKEILGRELEKGETRSDWLQRPLQEKQIVYAIQDVTYLLTVYDELMRRLQSLQRWTWLQEECAQLLENARQPALIEDYYRKIKSAWKLNRRQLAVLRALCAWREKKARSLDMPRNHIVPEKVLLELAIQQFTDEDALKSLKDFHRRQRQQFGKELIEIVIASQALPPDEYPSALPQPLSAEQKKLVKALKPLVETIAAEQSLPGDILVKKQDLEQLARSKQNQQYLLPPRLSGWRKAIVGDTLLTFANQWQL